MKRLGVLSIVILLVFGCKKDKPFWPQFPAQEDVVLDSSATHIFILNEGNFTFENASITAHEIETGNTRQQVFEKENGKSLGDVAQSMLVSGDIGFLAINNSNQIKKVKLPSLKEITTKAVETPRYCLLSSKGELWVSSLNGKEIVVLDTADLLVVRTVKTTNWIEEMEESDNHIFACNVKGNSVDVFSVVGAFVQSIAVGKQPQSIVEDENGFLWVLCDGGFNPRDRENATLHKIDPIKRAVLYTYIFDDIEASPSRLNYNASTGKLYFINRSVFEFNVQGEKAEPTELFKIDGANFYGLGINQLNDQLIVCDVRDYVKNGVVYVLDETGKQLIEFEAGVIPQEVVVYK